MIEPSVDPSVDPTATYLYMTTIGRKTGNPHRIEIWFTEHDGRHYMLSGGGEDAHWVKNILANASVRFSVGKRDDNNAEVPERAAIARPIDDSAEPELAAAVRAKMQAKYDWRGGMVIQVE